MKPKRKLKQWVKIALFMLPIAVIILQLFLVGIRIKNISDQMKEKQTFTIEYHYSCRCRYE